MRIGLKEYKEVVIKCWVLGRLSERNDNVWKNITIMNLVFCHFDKAKPRPGLDATHLQKLLCAGQENPCYRSVRPVLQLQALFAVLAPIYQRQAMLKQPFYPRILMTLVNT